MTPPGSVEKIDFDRNAITKSRSPPEDLEFISQAWINTSRHGSPIHHHEPWHAPFSIADEDRVPIDDSRPIAPPSLSDTLLWGTPYRPTQRIGRGGMGEVIEAEHVALGKPVVVKLLHPDLNARPHAVERLRIEAQALARLSHPNLVAVTDFGRTTEGRAYLVMERLRGRTFREELGARGPLPPAEAIDLVRQALAGLDAAHGAGLVHRDVKLDNLFLCDPDPCGRRVVKVLDFGIAKIVAPRAGGAPEPSPYLTEDGVLVGTPRFLSPEQAAGQPVDARADVYAAGLVLYTLLAGRGPFEHAGLLPDILRAHAAERPDPPSRHAPGPILPELDDAVMTALEKEPARRFPSAAAFAERLARIAEILVESRSAPARWLITERLLPGVAGAGTAPLSNPPVRPADLAATLPDLAALAGAGTEIIGAHPAAPPPSGAPGPHPAAVAQGALVPVLVVGAMMLGFALAVALRLGG